MTRKKDDKPKRPEYLYRPIDYAMDVLKFRALLRDIADGTYPVVDEMMGRLLLVLRPTLDAAEDTLEHENAMRRWQGLDAIEMGRGGGLIDETGRRWEREDD